MFTAIDHLMICVPDLARATEAYRRMGFDMKAGGVHPGKGTHNSLAFIGEDYLELLAIRDEKEHKATAKPGTTHHGMESYVAAGGGIRYVIIQSDDLAADVAAMRARGVDVSDPVDAGRKTPQGHDIKWKTASLGPKNPLPIFFIQQMMPMTERRRLAGAGDHPNGVKFLERTYIVVQDLAASVAMYSKVLGVSEPRMYKGTVIMSHMAVFQFGQAGLTIAHPYAPGPASISLEKRGPGPFQALYRTTSMGAAMRWMAKEGLPPPAVGTRDTGEKAILMPPSEACGAYIGFVGPE